MKKKFLSPVIILLLATLSGCSPAAAIVGTYDFEDVVISLTSATRDYLAQQKAGTEYIIEDSAFTIVQGEYEEKYSNISYKKEVLDDKIIEDNYDFLIDIFDKSKDRYRYSLYDEQGEKIRYYIFQLDGDIYICKYDRSDILVHWIDKVTKKE